MQRGPRQGYKPAKVSTIHTKDFSGLRGSELWQQIHARLLKLCQLDGSRRKVAIRLKRSGPLKRSFCTGEISRKNAQQTRLKIQPCALGQLSQSRINHGNSLIQKTRVHAQIREIEIV